MLDFKITRGTETRHYSLLFDGRMIVLSFSHIHRWDRDKIRNVSKKKKDYPDLVTAQTVLAKEIQSRVLDGWTLENP